MLVDTQLVDHNYTAIDKIRVGTLDELSGIGEEWLVDRDTRSCVLARFLNGNFITIDMGCPTLEESLAPTVIAA